MPVESTPRTTLERGVGKGSLTPAPIVTGMVAPPHRKRFGGFWLGAFFALGAVIGVRYLIGWVQDQGVAERLGFGRDSASGPVEGPPAPKETPPSPKETPMPKETAAPKETPPVVAAAPDARAVAAPVAVAPVAVASPTKPDGAASADAHAAETVVAADDDDQDEEALLKKAVPNAEQAVIGAEGAEGVEPEAKAEPKREPAGDSRDTKDGHAAAKPKAPAAKPTAILHITTNPVGAVVKTKAQVLGRTPINLHFRTGVTYELTFVKAGFEPTSRRVVVIGTKDKKVAVALKKKRAASPARKRHFFTPHR